VPCRDDRKPCKGAISVVKGSILKGDRAQVQMAVINPQKKIVFFFVNDMVPPRPLCQSFRITKDGTDRLSLILCQWITSLISGWPPSMMGFSDGLCVCCVLGNGTRLGCSREAE
jgi:hypothetical protein